jgi:2-(1,2-epoxy-1,2-dihydrophenyl)acetyl-CoA isomerase
LSVATASETENGEVSYSLDERGVLKVVLDRPERRNALTDVMVDELLSLLEDAGTDESVRALLLAGAGGDFCSGFDIVGRNQGGDRRPRTGSIQRRLAFASHRLVSTLMTVQVPVVCAVRGWAAGIGLHLALAADFAIADEKARLWEPFISRGFTPDSGATWLLPRRIGDVRAREMLLLGRELSGREAADWGLVHGAVAGEELDRAAGDLAGHLAAGPTVTLGLTKLLLQRAEVTSLDAHLQDEAFALELSSRSPDFREGLKAFQEKRRPNFGGL